MFRIIDFLYYELSHAVFAFLFSLCVLNIPWISKSWAICLLKFSIELLISFKTITLFQIIFLESANNLSNFILFTFKYKYVTNCHHMKRYTMYINYICIFTASLSVTHITFINDSDRLVILVGNFLFVCIVYILNFAVIY